MFTLIEDVTVTDDAIDDVFAPEISGEITDMNSLTTKLDTVFENRSEFETKLYNEINNFSEKLGTPMMTWGNSR